MQLLLSQCCFNATKRSQRDHDVGDCRVGQFKTAYDSCLESAKREGACAGVMFWDLTHAVSYPTQLHGRLPAAAENAREPVSAHERM